MLRWLAVAGLLCIGAWNVGCEDAGVACGDPGGVLDIVAPADADAAEPDDGIPSDAEGDGPTDPTCRPATPPTCFVDDVEVSCGIVVTLRLGDTSPRDWCEKVCAEGGSGLDWIVEPYCWTGVPYCLEVRDLSCDDCCLLPWSPSRERPDDGDPCTIDSCAGDTCTHEPADWIGEACENANDFGTCAGVSCCGAGCDAANPLYLGGIRPCSASIASEEVADGIDNDCDGEIDEAPEDAVFRLTDPGGGIEPAIVALDDGRFVVAWRVYQELVHAGGVYGNRTRMFVQVGTRQDPTGGIPIQVGGDQVGGLRLLALPQGRFALVWHESADPEAPPTVRVRVMRSPADPPLVDDTLPWSSWAVPAFAWPDGSFAVATYAGEEGETPPWQWMQRFDADGRRAGTFEIESLWGDPARSDPEATLAGDAQGRIVAAWRGPSAADETRTGFWARWFDGNGAPLTDAFELTTEAYRFQAESSGPFLAPLPDGRVIAGWSMRPVVEQGGRIRVRVLAGGVLPTEDPVMLGATPDDGRQVLASLGLAGDDVVATWVGAEVSNRSAGVHVTRIAMPALDAPESGPIRVSGPGIVVQAAGAVLADGTPVAVWRWQEDWRWGDLVGELRVGFPME